MKSFDAQTSKDGLTGGCWEVYLMYHMHACQCARHTGKTDTPKHPETCGHISCWHWSNIQQMVASQPSRYFDFKVFEELRCKCYNRFHWLQGLDVPEGRHQAVT